MMTTQVAGHRMCIVSELGNNTDGQMGRSLAQTNTLCEEEIFFLAHWGRYTMVDILTTFSNTFYWMANFAFCLEFHWSLFLMVQLAISQNPFGQWRPMVSQFTGAYVYSFEVQKGQIHGSEIPREIFLHSLKTKSFPDANFVVTGGTVDDIVGSVATLSFQCYCAFCRESEPSDDQTLGWPTKSYSLLPMWRRCHVIIIAIVNPVVHDWIMPLAHSYAYDYHNFCSSAFVRT